MPIDRCASGIQLFVVLPPFIDGDDRAIGLGDDWSQPFSAEFRFEVGIIVFRDDRIDLVGLQIQLVHTILMAGAEPDRIFTWYLDERIDMSPVFNDTAR